MPNRSSSWYEEAVIYSVDVEKFADGNDDGIGDFIGLTEKVPYLSELGITCIWLLPFYRSPDRDNGYDVSDFYSINPKVGTLDDFLTFLHSAGEHGIRVIVDLVVNHTSDQHPWFQAARRDDETRYRGYYVWSADPPPVAPGAKSIFPGEVESLWTYDQVARAYYFHSFYEFQPELNAANPQVREEMLRIVDYWTAFGVSGFRLDAAPLIIADKGLEHANPRDPHGILRQIGSYLQSRRPGGVLVGEVNLPPEASDAFFGEGEQLQLLLNFMLACYLFARFAREDASSINHGLSLLPEPPPGCGWVNFLRNLDELDFSRVSAELKKNVFDAFAPKEEMQAFGRGIRRRVAPMLSGDQRRIELAFSIIFSLSGPPLIVYGDEIGIGEDLSQSGRNTVRVPMQWSAEKNAGFSGANAGKLCQPIVADGPFSFKRVNVADQSKDPDSLLNGIRRFISLRRNQPIFTKGRMVRLSAADPAVLVHGFEDAGALLLLVHNLAGRPIETEINFAGMQPRRFRDLIGDVEYEGITQTRLELEPYAYHWFISEGNGS
ncbi:alpha-amylase family protein [Rhizobium lentis]|uniref:Maltose alpha-D-glucosyltransferase n=1 Tax=Rhizobium lentis TaxID=1138194 RepID=A0A9Q3MH16_9HYPH|nr:maltose alpha-D-glucosyltransferase [Rhizobium lentis]MBX5001180.1 maltose alpha-D-glucosyltransferase [Rhizobium lentis]MBX5019374.1 maltose alpha-D-glucosyltransferase [Rhizobium lentis]MBX5026545.1 maltose alpha-D-glucosyltransferase [Rhizobium lentis]MBX5050535.1 maltose alpha-D-glucosyltransferase [Rhizobium lentis]